MGVRIETILRVFLGRSTDELRHRACEIGERTVSEPENGRRRSIATSAISSKGCQSLIDIEIGESVYIVG